MAINFTNFLNADTGQRDYSSIGDIFENVLKGYKMEKEPAKMREEQQQRLLENQFKQLRNEHQPKEYELNDEAKSLANSLSKKAYEHIDKEYSLSDQLKQAQINKANQPEAMKGAFANALRLRSTLEPGSKDYNDVNDYIGKLKTGSNGIQVSSSPDGGIKVSVGGKSGEEAIIPGFPKMKAGEVAMYDKEGKPYAIGKPYSEKEKKEESGRAAFNIYQKYISDAQSPYSGSGSTKRFQSDVYNYTKDPNAKERIDKLLAADKLLFSAAVKEDATLGGANTNMAYKGLIKSLKSAEVYPLLKTLATFELPEGYSAASNDIFNQVLNAGTEEGKKIPAFKPYYLNNNSTKSSEKTTGKTYNLATKRWE